MVGVKDIRFPKRNTGDMLADAYSDPNFSGMSHGDEAIRIEGKDWQDTDWDFQEARRLISHESIHEGIDSAMDKPRLIPTRNGKRVGLDRKTGRFLSEQEYQKRVWSPEHILANEANHKLDTAYLSKHIRQPQSNFEESGIPTGMGCVNCGNIPAHMHGKHACCGRPGCHMKIYTEHWAYGEKRVSNHMEKNWPSLKGLMR